MFTTRIPGAARSAGQAARVGQRRVATQTENTPNAVRVRYLEDVYAEQYANEMKESMDNIRRQSTLMAESFMSVASSTISTISTQAQVTSAKVAEKTSEASVKAAENLRSMREAYQILHADIFTTPTESQVPEFDAVWNIPPKPEGTPDSPPSTTSKIKDMAVNEVIQRKNSLVNTLKWYLGALLLYSMYQGWEKYSEIHEKEPEAKARSTTSNKITDEEVATIYQMDERPRFVSEQFSEAVNRVKKNFIKEIEGLSGEIDGDKLVKEIEDAQKAGDAALTVALHNFETKMDAMIEKIKKEPELSEKAEANVELFTTLQTASKALRFAVKIPGLVKETAGEAIGFIGMSTGYTMHAVADMAMHKASTMAKGGVALGE